MKILVTGGSGFIGSHIAEKLSKKGHDITIIDNKKTKWILEDKIKFIKGDIRDLEEIEEITKNVDYIFHEAALVSVVESIEKPSDTFGVNLIGTLNILDAALKNNVEKVIFASSCAIYGNTLNLPTPEGEIPNPRSPYAISKLSAEYLMKMFYEEYGLRTTSLRYFNVYGPRQDYSSPYSAVIPIFIKRALNDDPLIIHGDGLQTRDFIFIDDVVCANEIVMRNGDGEIFNVGSGESISINDLAEIIIEITNSNSKIIHDEPRKGEVRHSCSDISKFRKIGFSPQFTLKKGLTKLISSFK